MAAKPHQKVFTGLHGGYDVEFRDAAPTGHAILAFHGDHHCWTAEPVHQTSRDEARNTPVEPFIGNHKHRWEFIQVRHELIGNAVSFLGRRPSVHIQRFQFMGQDIGFFRRCCSQEPEAVHWVAHTPCRVQPGRDLK